MSFTCRFRRGLSRVAAVAALAAALICAASGCRRSDEKGGGKASKDDSPLARIDLPASKPEYEFAEGLRDEYPEIAGFVQQFIETCLAGDYAEYRRLVSRLHDPESRERFAKIFHALKSLRIEVIEEVDIPHIAPPCYAVVSRVEFHPNQKVALRRGENRRIAMLVFREDDEWRMIPAPGEFQPGEEQPDAPPPEPPAPEVEYPWDNDVDY